MKEGGGGGRKWFWPVFSLLFAALRPTREKTGPALIACTCASFYPKNLKKDLEWSSKPPTRSTQNVGQCNYVFFLVSVVRVCHLRRYFTCYSIQTFPAGSFCRWHRRGAQPQRHMEQCCVYSVWSQFLKLCYALTFASTQIMFGKTSKPNVFHLRTEKHN